MRPFHLLAMAALVAGVTFALASCTGDDDITPTTKVDAGPDNNVTPPPPPPPGDGGDGGGNCVELHTFAIDMIQNKTLESNKPDPIDTVNFCTPDREDLTLYNGTLFP